MQQPPSGAQSPSPCIKVCILDPRTNRCIGCGRTIAEIAACGEEALAAQAVAGKAPG